MYSPLFPEEKRTPLRPFREEKSEENRKPRPNHNRPPYFPPLHRRHTRGKRASMAKTAIPTGIIQRGNSKPPREKQWQRKTKSPSKMAAAYGKGNWSAVKEKSSPLSHGKMCRSKKQPGIRKRREQRPYGAASMLIGGKQPPESLLFWEMPDCGIR